jgi:hypothetical protein
MSLILCYSIQWFINGILSVLFLFGLLWVAGTVKNIPRDIIRLQLLWQRESHSEFWSEICVIGFFWLIGVLYVLIFFYPFCMFVWNSIQP